ncbi:salicylate synthase [Streptomyces sp. WAC05292]|uniref:salicylate synthase n=1 Tax=Streptomyces sp. WAC05292 TaxID=2487418 RepID=UPI000F735E60|nr:salicylate synthase [Streptomyces sp. WAC05292]RSS79826.1 salicylate synthase [Streptomyces sp. WAC05292]
MSPYYVETRIEPAEDQLAAAAALADSGLHDDYVVYEGPDGWSYAGGTLAELTLDRTGARLSCDGERFLPWDGKPLRQVQSLLDTLAVDGWRAYGWAAFELSYAKDGSLDHVGGEKLLHLVVPRTEVRFEGATALVRSADPEGLVAALDVLRSPGRAGGGRTTRIDVRGFDKTDYRSSVESAVAEIHEDRLQKVILSRVVEVEDDIDLVETYVRGRRGNTPARSFLLRLGGVEAAGFSPETVVEVESGGRVYSQPLAGTRALTQDPQRNRALREDLLSDPKEIYEHAISVKVGTDELTDVSQAGSVEVPEFMAVKERGSVQHLASRVSGRLADGFGTWDAFGAVFPAVTASGVPKDAAYDVIRQYEPERRGLYSGAVLTVDEDGGMDAALVLRSVYRQGGRTWLRAGAGIVGQSTAAREFEETSEKLESVSRFLVAADGADGADGPQARLAG